MKSILLAITICSVVLIIDGCKESKPINKEINNMDNTSLSLPEWAINANIYEVNIRQYTPEGTFDAFAKHLPRLKEMGVDILWFMPIFPISTSRKKGTLGSYYAVSDFRTTNPEFGSIGDFEKVIEQAHSLGMKVILDWVPNHTGWDHIWIKDHPDFYTKGADGQIIDPLNEHGESMGWTDVADLNYDSKDMRLQMISDMVYWLEKYNIDGFRHDMALLVPLDFWKEAIVELKKAKPDLFMLAEAENHELVNEDCFHMLYGWTLHHTLNDIAKGHKNAGAIDQWLQNERPKLQKGMYMHFTSNHDENSWSGSEIERMGEGSKAFAVLVNTFDGMPLTYSGQEEPMSKRLEFFEKDNIGFQKFENKDFYFKLNDLRHNHPALWHHHSAAPLIKIANHDQVFAFKRTAKEKSLFVIINLSKNPQVVRLDEAVRGMEIFTNKEIFIEGGAEVSMEPWSYKVISSNL
ncbi:MAG: alpha-glucosidase C-terminal domain-containing protein [Saprospiraceae bacterium]|nr:alpha-glucosidase C-terminal domain-containing protein [Saprospiraceae bacterium]